MSDTIKIPRPKFARRVGGVGGRVEHDERGNAVWVRSRATDSQEVTVNPTLELIDDPSERRSGSRRPSVEPRAKSTPVKSGKKKP